MDTCPAYKQLKSCLSSPAASPITSQSLAYITFNLCFVVCSATSRISVDESKYANSIVGTCMYAWELPKPCKGDRRIHAGTSIDHEDHEVRSWSGCLLSMHGSIFSEFESQKSTEIKIGRIALTVCVHNNYIKLQFQWKWELVKTKSNGENVGTHWPLRTVMLLWTQELNVEFK